MRYNSLKISPISVPGEPGTWPQAGGFNGFLNLVYFTKILEISWENKRGVGGN